MSLAASMGMPCCSVITCLTVLPAAGSMSPRFRFFTGDVAFDEARLQHVPDGFELEVVLGGQRQRVGLLIEIDRRARALEIEALADFLARLIDSVVDLRHVDGRGDVE